MKRGWRHRFGIILFALACCPAAADDGKEYLVKSAFMYNFVKFVEWPGEFSVSKQSQFNICVIGSNPFPASAKEIFTRASTPNLKIGMVDKGAWSGGAEGCHMAYIALSEKSRAAEIISALKVKPVLTVSDIDGFATRGGAVEFTTQDNKIKLIVNTSAATAAGLRVDAQLLEIALKVIR